MFRSLHLFALVIAGLACLFATTGAAAMYDPGAGRFMQRDPHPSIYPDGLNAYAAYHVMWGGVDPSGLTIVSKCEIDKYLKEKKVSDYGSGKLKGFYVYYHRAQYNKADVESEILGKMIISGVQFNIKGDTEESCLENIKAHVAARVRVITRALTANYNFGVGGNESYNDDKIAYETKNDAGDRVIRLRKGKTWGDFAADVDENPDEYRFGCAIGINCVYGDLWDPDLSQSADVDPSEVWIPGDSGFIRNKHYDGTRGLEGQNIIYMTREYFWGHLNNNGNPANNRKKLDGEGGWMEYVNQFNAPKKSGAEIAQRRQWPGTGLLKRD